MFFAGNNSHIFVKTCHIINGDSMKNYSIWKEALKNEYQSLNEDSKADIVIIGGGITGISLFYHLRNTSLKVILAERSQIGSGVTCKSTAKATFLQGNIYGTLYQKHSFAVARKYLESQQTAIQLMTECIHKNQISCDYQKTASYIYSKNYEDILKEKRVLESLHVPVWEEKKEEYYTLKVEETFVFHPVKFLQALAKMGIKKNHIIYEESTLTKIKKEEGYYNCYINNHIVKAKKVVLATHYPYFLWPLLFPLQCYLEKSYLINFSSTNEETQGISLDDPIFSYRFYKNSKIYLTGSHDLGFKLNDAEHFQKLEQQANGKKNYIWSNKDIMTNDSLPFVGALNNSSIYIATGFNTWGMTNGFLAGEILIDAILNQSNPYASLFLPNRINKMKAIELPRILLNTGKSFIGSKLNPQKKWYPKSLHLEKRNGKSIFVYVDKNGIQHKVWNRCPHLGCGLIFNEIEETFDCPCHGSRFDLDGKAIEGPSNFSIAYHEE